MTIRSVLHNGKSTALSKPVCICGMSSHQWNAVFQREIVPWILYDHFQIMTLTMHQLLKQKTMSKSVLQKHTAIILSLTTCYCLLQLKLLQYPRQKRFHRGSEWFEPKHFASRRLRNSKIDIDTQSPNHIITLLLEHYKNVCSHWWREYLLTG